jgi:hypothetical protein
MGKAKEFENILNECLDRLIKGESIEACLARYPQYATELEPLLKTALETKMAAAVKPNPEFRQRAGNEFQAAIRDFPPQKPRNAFRWQLRWAAPVAVVLAILVGGTGTVVAATNSLPDSPLYTVKMATESVQMAFTFSEQGKAELYARFADYRVEEIVKMAEKGDLDLVEQATERMNSQLLAMANLKLNGENPQKEAGAFGLMASVPENQPSTDTNVPGATMPPKTSTTTPTTANESPLLANPPAPILTTTPGIRNGTAETSALTDKEKLIQRLLEDMERNLQILRNQLEKAPDALKLALQKAIEVVEEGYALVIANLG